MADLEDFKISIDAKFSDIIVPTMDTIRSTYVLELLLSAQKTVDDSFFTIVNVTLVHTLGCEKDATFIFMITFAKVQ